MNRRLENSENLARLNKDILKNKPLSSEDQDKLLLEYYDTKCTKKRDKLFRCNMRLVMRIINQWGGLTELNKEELFSIASVGAINAIDTFNPHLGYKLSTLIRNCVHTELINYYRKYGSIIRKKVTDFRDIEDGIKTDYKYISTSMPINEDGDTLIDLIGEFDNYDDMIDMLDRDIREEEFWKYIRTIVKREKHYNIIKALYDRNSRGPSISTMRDIHIAEMYGVTKQRIGQIKRNMIEKFKNDEQLKKMWETNVMDY